VSVFLWNRRQDYHHAVLAEHINSAAPGWSATHDSLARVGMSEPAIRAVTEGALAQQASTLAINDTYLVYAAIIACLIPVLWLARPPFQPPPGSSGAH
jgi:DHA2 family multidrug resistance protein